MPEDARTHHQFCWDHHPDCARARIADLEARSVDEQVARAQVEASLHQERERREAAERVVEEVERWFERDFWTRVREALATYRAKYGEEK